MKPKSKEELQKRIDELTAEIDVLGPIVSEMRTERNRLANDLRNREWYETHKEEHNKKMIQNYARRKEKKNE